MGHVFDVLLAFGAFVHLSSDAERIDQTWSDDYSLRFTSFINKLPAIEAVRKIDVE